MESIQMAVEALTAEEEEDLFEAGEVERSPAVTESQTVDPAGELLRDHRPDAAGAGAAEGLALRPAETPEMGGLPMADWDYQQPKRGQIRPGVILSIGEQQIIVGLGLKRDGVVPYSDMQRLGQEAIAALKPGDAVDVLIQQPEDQEGNTVVSLYLARQQKAWQYAAELAEAGTIWDAQVVGYNKGGLVVPVGELRGFVPASQVPGFARGLSQEERLRHLSAMVGKTLKVKVIEVNRRDRRLVLSAIDAEREWRQRERERLIAGLREGEVRRGIVSSLAPFGAFVDLGGADGLVHITELAWRRVRHPREVVAVGDQVNVYVLRLDGEHNRIALSMKRLQPEPWARVEDKYELGQLVEGVVTNVIDFGAFAQIEDGIEGLIHASELTDEPLSHPRDIVKRGDCLLLRIIRIDLRRKRLGLSLKRVLDSEWSEWEARRSAAQEASRGGEPRSAPRRGTGKPKPRPRPTPVEGPRPPVRQDAPEPATPEEIVPEAAPQAEGPLPLLSE